MRLLIVFLISGVIYAQEFYEIKGQLVDYKQSPLPNVPVALEGTSIVVLSNNEGKFSILTDLNGNYILKVSLADYQTQRIPVVLGTNQIDLGIIILQEDITVEYADNLITLTDADLSDDSESVQNASGLLQATRDVFLTRAAFDFGQAFFRVRGFDASRGKVLINGITMNKAFDGRPQWNNWGGLNDVIRNQEFSNGLAQFNYGFGGVLGSTNINTRPSAMRSGTRLSTSISNRTYVGRLMATYNSGQKKNGLTYAFSGSRRWANSGYIDGTLYNAYSLFGALEYKIDTKNTLMLTALLAKNRRGRSAAITKEVFELKGNQYNPYWGKQNGEIRNSRTRDINEPILMLNHYFNSKNISITNAIAYQFGKYKRGRLGYYNAPNPDPTYYRYLPSFYINSPIGADFTNANLAREGFFAKSTTELELFMTPIVMQLTTAKRFIFYMTMW